MKDIKPSPERRKIAAYLNRYAREVSGVAVKRERGKYQDRYWVGYRDALECAALEVRESYDVKVSKRRSRTKGVR